MNSDKKSSLQTNYHKIGKFFLFIIRFSVQSAMKVYEKYLKLDADHNGLLKKAEL